MQENESSLSGSNQLNSPKNKISKLKELIMNKKLHEANFVKQQVIDEEEIAKKEKVEQEKMVQKKLEEVKLKARNRKVKKKKDKKKNEGPPVLIDPDETKRLQQEERERKEREEQEALEYLDKIIRRDSKPTNPEKNIMIRLFDKMQRAKIKVPYYEKLQREFREKAEEIRENSQLRGFLMPSEIETSAKPALNIIGMAFGEIDYEEQVNPKMPRLTTIQRNRMAISFLEMNDIPRNFLYYKRFIDPEDEEAKQDKLQTQKTIANKTKTIDIQDPVQEEFLKKTFEKLRAKKLQKSNKRKEKRFKSIDITKVTNSKKIKIGVNDSIDSSFISLFDENLISDRKNSNTQYNSNINNQKQKKPSQLNTNQSPSINVLDEFANQSFVIGGYDSHLDISRTRYAQKKKSEQIDNLKSKSVQKGGGISNFDTTNLKTVSLNSPSGYLQSQSVFTTSRGLSTKKRESILLNINNQTKYLKKSIEMIEKEATDTLAYHSGQKLQISLKKQLSPIRQILKQKNVITPQNLSFRGPDYKEMLHDVDKEAYQMKLIKLTESKQIDGDPRFRNLNDTFEKIQHIQYIHNLEKSQLKEISQRIKELLILKNERRYGLN